MLQSCRFPLLCIGVAVVAVLTTAAPTEIPEETSPIADPREADGQPPSRPALGGWSSLIGGLSRRRSSSDQESSRNGRRNNQPHSGGRRRGQQLVLASKDENPVDSDDVNAIDKTRRRGSDSKNRQEQETLFKTVATPQKRPEPEVSSTDQQAENDGEGGGRFGRGNGGRRGDKKNEDIEAEEVKSEGRRSKKNKDKSEPEQNESQPQGQQESNPDPSESQSVIPAAPGLSNDHCEDLLATRAGSARETIAALLENIDSPDVLEPILLDLDANLNGPVTEQP